MAIVLALESPDALPRNARGSNTCEVLKGTYASVSESEWHVTLRLAARGMATIRHEAWLAGEYEERSIKKFKGSWSCEGQAVEVRYKGVVDRFAYTATLPYAEFGFEGAGPGLVATGPVTPTSTNGGATLWHQPMNTGNPL